MIIMTVSLEAKARLLVIFVKEKSCWELGITTISVIIIGYIRHQK